MADVTCSSISANAVVRFSHVPNIYFREIVLYRCFIVHTIQALKNGINPILSSFLCFSIYMIHWSNFLSIIPERNKDLWPRSVKSIRVRVTSLGPDSRPRSATQTDDKYKRSQKSSARDFQPVTNVCSIILIFDVLQRRWGWFQLFVPATSAL